MSTTADYTNHTMARCPFSTTAFAQLVRRLRHTNARYDQIAQQYRCRIRPTHHARRRAYMAGLRIDTTKARACPSKYISVHSPPVLDRSAGSPDPVPAEAHATAQNVIGVEEHAMASQGDAYMRVQPLRNLPGTLARKQYGRDGRPRITLRLPPLKLHLNVGYSCGVDVSECQDAVPGAPRLGPRQLPEDECGMEQIMLGTMSSSSTDESDVLLTPYDVDIRMYSGLCITIPPRSFKRKMKEVEDDIDATFPSPQHPKRVMMARWNESQGR